LVLAALGELVTNIATAHGLSGELELVGHSYPVTVNNAAFADDTLQVAKGIAGDLAILMPTPVMGAEDWSRVLREVKGSMAFLGGAPSGVDKPAPNHSNLFMVDEDAMATGIALYAAMALSTAGD
jgi:hippurate hydrolase